MFKISTLAVGGWSCDTACFANNPSPDLQEGLGELEIKPESTRMMVCATENFLEDANVNAEAWIMEKVSQGIRATVNASVACGGWCRKASWNFPSICRNLGPRDSPVNTDGPIFMAGPRPTKVRSPYAMACSRLVPNRYYAAERKLTWLRYTEAIRPNGGGNRTAAGIAAMKASTPPVVKALAPVRRD